MVSRLRSDAETVAIAVRSNGSALGLATDVLKGNRELVLAATTQSADALQAANALCLVPCAMGHGL